VERRSIQQPEGLSKPPTYSHVITVSDATLVFIAGQVAYDAQGQIVGKGDVVAQAGQVWENLTRALAAAGATSKDLVKITTFVVGYRTELRQLLGDVRAKYVPGPDLPTSTLVGVAALALPEFLIEIEAVAAIPTKR
jgi:enamine deaminase RidA (YjgF/YER057c/UK114 family)